MTKDRACLHHAQYTFIDCIDCTGYNHMCPDYLPDVFQQGKFLFTRKPSPPVETLHNTIRPFFWYHSTPRSPPLPKRTWRSIIWKANDRGVI